MENKKQSSGFSPSSSSFDSLSTSDDVESGSSSLFPRYPSSFYGRRMGVGPRSPRFFASDEDDGAHHFLDSCHLCKRPIGSGRDIFMYRGDTPFCSEECRQEQIEMDEAEEKRAKLSKNQQQKNNKSSTSPSKIHMRVTGTVVAG